MSNFQPLQGVGRDTTLSGGKFKFLQKQIVFFRSVYITQLCDRLIKKFRGPLKKTL